MEQAIKEKKKKKEKWKRRRKVDKAGKGEPDTHTLQYTAEEQR